MATGICYTQSGGVKKYERDQLEHNYMESSDKHITVYTVGYPSTTYYPDGYDYSFNIFTYPGPGGDWPMPPEFTEGTAEYLYYINTNPSTPDENWHDTHSKIYNLMSYTPPDGYVLDKNGNYTYTAEAKIYSCNLDVKYGGITNSINGGTDTMYKQFRYKKKSINQSKVYVSLSVSEDMVLNNVVYHPYDSTQQTIYTIDMSTSIDDFIDIVIGLSSRYHTGAFYLIFKDGNGNIIQAKKYQDIQLVVDRDLSFPVDNTNSKCIISKYSNTLENVGYIYTSMDGLGYTFGSSGWSNNTLYTESNWTINGGIPGPSNMKIDHYQSSFKITLNGYTKTIWLTTKIQSIRHFG